MPRITRREWLAASAAATSASVLSGPAVSAQDAARPEQWRLALNTSTIRPASMDDKIGAAAKAGYDAIELWVNDLTDCEKAGKSLEDLGKRIKDLGLEVVNVIGLWNSMPPNEADKAKTDAEIRLKLQQAAKVGARHIAAIPTPDRPDLPVLWAAKRYRELMDMGEELGIVVAIEFVGFLKGIHTLGQAAAIAVEADHPKACIVGDTFHIYRGGSTYKGVTRLQGASFAVCHFNDVPKDPPQFELKDAHRIYPGDGILPLPQFLRDLWATGFRGPLSLEIFNAEEWKKSPYDVARVGIEKVRAVIASSGVGG